MGRGSRSSLTSTPLVRSFDSMLSVPEILLSPKITRGLSTSTDLSKSQIAPQGITPAAAAVAAATVHHWPSVPQSGNSYDNSGAVWGSSITNRSMPRAKAQSVRLRHDARRLRAVKADTEPAVQSRSGAEGHDEVQVKWKGADEYGSLTDQ